MKKILLFLSFLILVGCSNGSTQYTLKEEMSLDMIVDKVNKELVIAKVDVINNDIMSDILNIDIDNIEMYSGVMSNNMMGGDLFVIIKAKSDKIDVVKEKIEEYKLKLIAQQYMPVEVEKAKMSKIYIKGDYISYILLGNAFTVESNQEKIQDFIDKAVLIIDDSFIKNK